MATTNPDPYTLAAQQMSQWLDETASQLTDALRAGGQAPFAAPVSQAQKLAYYDQVLFNPDGSPNQAGRQAEMQRLGVNGYVGLLGQVTKARQERMGSVGKVGAQAAPGDGMTNDADSAPTGGG